MAAMPLSTDLARSLIDALDEPALIVEGSRTMAANRAPREPCSAARIEGTDIRFAIRHPEALSTILAGSPPTSSWSGSARPIDRGLDRHGRSSGQRRWFA